MLDFQPWDQLLRQYVDEQGRVNYRAWKAEASQPLQDWLHQVSELDWPSLSSQEQLALWLNLYNALTIAQILPQYPIASIQPKILGIPNGFAFLRFFLRPIYSISNQRYSLNDIEHQILRPQFHEPRIHFALVCASQGCPLLRNQAYQPNIVRQQLEVDVDRFVNNPDKVRYDGSRNILYCSKIFKWYRQDFLKQAPSVSAYIRSYLKTDGAINAATRIAYLPYDWRLNDSQPNRESAKKTSLEQN